MCILRCSEYLGYYSLSISTNLSSLSTERTLTGRFVCIALFWVYCRDFRTWKSQGLSKYKRYLNQLSGTTNHATVKVTDFPFWHERYPKLLAHVYIIWCYLFGQVHKKPIDGTDKQITNWKNIYFPLISVLQHLNAFYEKQTK